MKPSIYVIADTNHTFMNFIREHSIPKDQARYVSEMRGIEGVHDVAFYFHPTAEKLADFQAMVRRAMNLHDGGRGYFFRSVKFTLDYLRMNGVIS